MAPREVVPRMATEPCIMYAPMYAWYYIDTCVHLYSQPGQNIQLPKMKRTWHKKAKAGIKKDLRRSEKFLPVSLLEKKIPVWFVDPRSSCFSFEMKHPKYVHDAQFCTSASILQLSLDKEGLVSYHHSHHSVVPGPTQKSDRWHIWATVPLCCSEVTNAQLKPEAKMMI